MAAFAFLLCRRLRCEVERHLTTLLPSSALVWYVDEARHDETPMKTTIKGDSKVSSTITVRADQGRDGPCPAAGCEYVGPTCGPLAVCDALELDSDVASGVIAVEVSESKVALIDSQSAALAAMGVKDTVRTEAKVTKLLQSKLNFACVINVVTTFVAIIGHMLDTVTPIASTCARCVRLAQLRISGVSPWSQKFCHKTRISCLDRHKANAIVERTLVRDRGHGWDGLATDCGIHVQSTQFEKAFSCSEFDISGIVRS